MKSILYHFLIAVLFFSCSQEEKRNETPSNSSNEFAQNFHISTFEDYQIIEVSHLLDNSDEVYKYVLHKNEPPKGIENAIFIQTPIKNAACLSTTHIAMLTEIGAASVVKSATNVNLIFNADIAKRAEQKEIVELGNEGNLNYERLIDQKPDVVFTYGLTDLNQIKKLQSLGLKPVVVAEFREQTPLARAEWIKFFSAFVAKESKANSIFTTVKEEYQTVVAQTKSIQKRPTVFTGIPFQGVWYVPTGESYLAQLIQDAGGDYLWKDSKGALSLSLDLEAVFAKANSAEKWLDVGFVFSKEAVQQNDKRMSKFSAFQTGEMYNYTARVNPNGGFDIYESAIVYPNIVLKDFVKILQPSLLPQHELFYYVKM